jgi:cullin 3
VYPSDSFSFNVEFAAPLQKIKISTVAARVEDADERKETRDRVDEERKHQMDVCALSLYTEQGTDARTGVCGTNHEGP